MTPEQIYKFAALRANATKGGVCWLRDPDGEDKDDQRDFCRECITALPLLPCVLVLHLLTLAGIELPPSPADEWKYDRSWGNYLLDRVEKMRDGGWAMEADSWRTCDYCDADLELLPTDYMIESELAHWEESGPPDGPRQWWEFSVMLDALPNYWMPDAAKDPKWIEVCALMEKWTTAGVLTEEAPHDH